MRVDHSDSVFFRTFFLLCYRLLFLLLLRLIILVYPICCYSFAIHFVFQPIRFI